MKDGSKDGKGKKVSELGLAAFILGAVANGLVFLLCFRFIFVPSGSSIRPMGLVWLIFLISLAALVVVLPMSIWSLIHHKLNKWAIYGIIFSLSPFPLAIIIMKYSSYVKGFEFSP